MRVDFAPLTTPADRVVIVATEPLTANEPWARLGPGELHVFSHGGPAGAASASRGNGAPRREREGQ